MNSSNPIDFSLNGLPSRGFIKIVVSIYPGGRLTYTVNSLCLVLIICLALSGTSFIKNNVDSSLALILDTTNLRKIWIVFFNLVLR